MTKSELLVYCALSRRWTIYGDFTYGNAFPDLRTSTNVAEWVHWATSNASSKARASNAIADSARWGNSDTTGVFDWSGRNQSEGSSNKYTNGGGLHFER